jgi:hypothetical protein
MTAKDFDPFYKRFGCPTEHLAQAFGCVVAEGGDDRSEDLARRVERCWADPQWAVNAQGPSGVEPPEGEPAQGSANGT